MNHPPYWDYPTFIFYYLVGITSAIIIGLHFGSISIRGLYKNNEIHTFFTRDRWNGYAPLIILLILFACLRKVGQGIGGTDSLSYERDFLNSLNGLGNFEDTDILYGQYSLYLRHLTSSPLIFRLVSYSFIAFSFCYFIKEICPSKVSWIPFILIVWPYICSFNTMRSSMAVGFILLGLVALYKENYFLEWIFIIICVLFHRMMFVFVPVFIIYKPIYKIIIKSNRTKLYLLLGSSIFFTTLLAFSIQKFVLLMGFLDNPDSPDASYIAKSLDNNLFDSWPMYIQQIFLLIFLFINFKKFKSRKEQFILVLSCVDAVITLPALILGIWRISQCLYIPTLMLWGILLYNFNQKFTRSIRPLISIFFFLGFSFILYSRIDSIYESSSLMPYILFWN